MKTVISAAFAAALLATSLAMPAGARNHEWGVYSGPGYRFVLPMEGYEVVEQTPGRIALAERAGATHITAYAGENEAGANLAQYRAMLETAAPIDEITYRAGGRSWFVLSGYTRDGSIWYAKVMFSGDGSRFSGFEITYPRSDKRRMDAVVTRIEKGLRVGG